MTAWLRQHRQACVRAARRMGVLNALVIGIALALPAGGYALLESLRALTGRVSLEPQISLFLDAKRADVDALARDREPDRRRPFLGRARMHGGADRALGLVLW